MNKRFILVLVVMILFLGFSIYQYVTVFHSELANAYTIKPANGHSWSEMECTTGLCVTADNKVGMGTDSPIEKLSVVGNISATGTIKATGNISTSGTLTATGDVCSNGGTNCLSSGTPSGAIMFFNLASCPSGWTELTAARGRYLVGLTSGGTLAGTAGTALTNLENRAVGSHTHAVTDPGHSHTFTGLSSVIGTYGPHSYSAYVNSYTSVTTDSATTGISIASSGSVAGTNAPYLQLLICQKN